MPPHGSPPPPAAAAIAPCPGNTIPPPAGGESPLDTTLWAGAQDVREIGEIAKSSIGSEVDTALVEEKQGPPAAAIAPYSGNQVLPPADGERPLDMTVSREIGEIAKSRSGGEVDTALVEGLGDETKKMEEKQADMVKAHTGQLIIDSSRSSEEAAKALKLTKELSLKILDELGKRSSLWIGFLKPEEEIEFVNIEDSMNSCNENTTMQTYIARLKKVKKMAKLIDARFKEHLNREASLQKLLECIDELGSRPVLTLGKQADLVKAKLLLSNKLEKQRNLQKFEDSILKCQEMDQMRKKLEEPRRPPVENFLSTVKEDIYFNPARNLLKSFIGYLCNRLIDHDQYGKILNSYLLAYQTTAGEQPAKWICIHLLGTGDDKIVIYLRSDNGNFIGFENKNGVRFELAPGDRSELARLIQNSTFISCDVDYASLMNFERMKGGIFIDETAQRLLDLQLDKKSFIEDIHILSNYSCPLPGARMERFQKALTRIRIIICESCRINQILQHVDAGWDSCAKLSPLLLQYIWKYSDISQALRTWKTDKSRMFSEALQEKILMVYPEEATNVIFLVLNDQGPGIIVQSADGGDEKPGSDQYVHDNATDILVLPKTWHLPPRLPSLGLLELTLGGNMATRVYSRFQSRPDLVPLRKKPTAGSPSVGLLELTLDEYKPTPVYRWSQLPLLDLIPPRAKPVVGSLTGQLLIEVSGVSSNFPFVGNIVVFDERWGMTICQRDDWDKSSSEFEGKRNLWMQKGNAATDFKDNLILTGPSRAITANGGFAIKIDVPARGRKAREITKFSWNYSDSPIYNEPKICTIKTRRGCLYVTYAVLNEALEGFLGVRLRLPPGLLPAEGVRVCGIIRARVDKHENVSMLFCREVEEAVHVFTFGDSIILPLTRSVLPLPLRANLHITGELDFVGCGISTVINHCIRVEEEKVHTEWVKNGMCSSAVQLWLRPIF